MVNLLREQRPAIAELCRRFEVARLTLFGSAVTADFDPGHSDVDFLVEFDAGSPLSRFDAYFGLKEGLEGLLGYPVDLVALRALENPYFAETVRRTQEEIYAA